MKGLDGFRTVNLQYSHSLLLLDVLLKAECGDEEYNKGSEGKKARTLRNVNNMYEESKKSRGALQTDRSHQDYTGPLLFLDKKICILCLMSRKIKPANLHLNIRS